MPRPLESVEGETVGAVLAARARQSPDAPLIFFGDDVITYGGMQRGAVQGSQGLRNLGVGKGDRVAIAGLNRPDWLVAYFAAARIGAILVTLNVVYREREFTYMLNQSGARVLICEQEAGGFDFRPFLEELAPRIPSVETFVYLGADGEDSWHRLAATPAPEDVSGVVDVAPDDPAVILYTSGTTGEPKGAVLTHHSLLASAAAQAVRFEQTASDVILGVMPFNHVGGITCTVGSALVSGCAVALLPQFHPDLVAEAVPRRRVTMFVGVPTMYRMLLGSQRFAQCDVSSVRLCVVGGSNLEPVLSEQVAERFGAPRMANLYGLSETSGACVISPEGDSLQMVSTTIGTMLTGFDGRIVADDGAVLGPDAVGELQVRGGCVAAGFWGKPGETAAAFGPDGWLATGDIGSISGDGHVRIVARKKEMYVRGGYNVYPAEVENVIVSDPSVGMCAVIGVPDVKYGESGRAFVVPAADAVAEPEALLAMCRRALAEYKVPDVIEVVDSLPMTPAGKIRKVALRRGPG